MNDPKRRFAFFRHCAFHSPSFFSLARKFSGGYGKCNLINVGYRWLLHSTIWSILTECSGRKTLYCGISSEKITLCWSFCNMGSFGDVILYIVLAIVEGICVVWKVSLRGCLLMIGLIIESKICLKLSLVPFSAFLIYSCHQKYNL